MKLRNTLLAALGLAFAATAAHAEIKVGVVLSATGPAASLGIPEKNTIALMPTTIGGEKVSYIVLDDASDTTTAVKNARKLTVEDGVDVIIGSTTSPASLAIRPYRNQEQFGLVRDASGQCKTECATVSAGKKKDAARERQGAGALRRRPCLSISRVEGPSHD